MRAEAVSATSRYEQEYEAMDLAIVAVSNVVDAPEGAPEPLTEDLVEALSAGLYRLAGFAGLVEAIEAKLERGDRIDADDAMALARLYRRLDNGLDNGGPGFQLVEQASTSR